MLIYLADGFLILLPKTSSLLCQCLTNSTSFLIVLPHCLIYRFSYLHPVPNCHSVFCFHKFTSSSHLDSRTPTCHQATSSKGLCCGIPQNLCSHVHSYLIFCAATTCPYLLVSVSHICNYRVFLSRAFILQVAQHLNRLPKRLTSNTQSSKLPITPSIHNRIYTTVNFSSSLDILSEVHFVSIFCCAFRPLMQLHTIRYPIILIIWFSLCHLD